MNPKVLLSVVVGSAALALVTLMGAADPAHATFNPTVEITLVDATGGASADITAELNVPEGDVNFAGIVAFIPREWQITPGDEISIGAVVGDVTAQATLGLINGPCSNVLPVDFIMLNSSIDPSDTVSYLDTDALGEEGYNEGDVFEDKDGTGLPDAFERYPDFITRLLDDVPGDEVGQPLTPLRRAAGITTVAGVQVLLQFLVFEPGTFLNEIIPNDEELGFPTITLLQNIGDPDADPMPSAITDFCTPLTTSNTTFGISKDNSCTAAVPADELDPLCEVRGVVLAEDGPTDPDEGGQVLFANPPEGTYTFTTIAAGQRDADGDGFENSLDTCAFVVNEGDPRIGSDGDADNDGLDAACDPDDTFTNSDEDLDGFTNRQDNCPLDANGEDQDNQRDTDNDGIGDVCDLDPDDAEPQGEITIVEVVADVTIGPGGEPVDDTVGDEDDGGGSGTVIIIIVVIAAIAVVGGGAFFLARRGSGGGGGAA